MQAVLFIAMHSAHTAEVFPKNTEAFKPVISDARNLQPQWADWKWFDHLSPEDALRICQCPLHKRGDSECMCVCVSVWVCVCVSVWGKVVCNF